MGEVAIKRLKMTADTAAHREMVIGEELANRSLIHVVPVLDFGQDANSDRYYLVMPVCEFSLAQKLEHGVLSWPEASKICLDVISGLMEVENIVHRDLKPGNVLFHDGLWKIADFGIAKFIEDSTSVETLRRCLTPAFAAPEQWRGERPTHATDVYALACMVYAMLSGGPPFSGGWDEVREAHLNREPPNLGGVDERIQSLVRLMLRKSQEIRPSLSRCRDVIASVNEGPLEKANQGLAAAAAEFARREAAAESARRAAEDERLARKRVAEESRAELERICDRLFAEVEVACVAASRIKNNQIALGAAELEYRPVEVIDGSKIGAGWEVLSYSVMSISLGNHFSKSIVYNSTLAFCKTNKDSSFRWREMSFFNFARLGRLRVSALTPRDADFYNSIAPVVNGWQFAFGPKPIDGEDEAAFKERWLNLFARGISGKWREPNELPLQDSFFT
ncbi:serine/threonine-protein kinase [Azorhizobium sp. AG788]|nr:serine/threonine-protein kinase [Azorhizobium sp. AG788]